MEENNIILLFFLLPIFIFNIWFWFLRNKNVDTANLKDYLLTSFFMLMPFFNYLILGISFMLEITEEKDSILYKIFNKNI